MGQFRQDENMSAIPQYGFKAEDIVAEGRTTQSNIDQMKRWLTTRRNIPEMSDEQVVLFLMACKNVVEDTKITIDNYFRQRYASPELFRNRDVDSKENQFTHNVTKFAIFPNRSKDNDAIVLGGLRDTTYYNWCIEPQIKVFFTLIDVLIQSDPPNGLIFLMDIKGVGIMHLTRLKVGPLKKFFAYLQEALPIQLKSVHIMNASYIFEKLLAIAKPFMKKELFDLIIAHPPGTNMEEFFEKHIPASCMPSDFGGQLPSLDKLSEDFQNQCRKLKVFVDQTEKQVLQYKPEK